MAYKFEWDNFRVTVTEGEYGILGPPSRVCRVEERNLQGEWIPIPRVKKFSFEIDDKEGITVSFERRPYPNV